MALRVYLRDDPGDAGASGGLTLPPLQPEGYRYVLWEPKLCDVVPPGASPQTYGAFWLMHRLRLFSNRDFAVVVAFDGRRPVHRLGIFPRSFRFPFMQRDDLQIGDVWTDPAHRGRGLAAYGIRYALARRRHRCGHRRFWYLVDEHNLSSIRAAERAGFTLRGSGQRTAPFGLRLLGTYDVDVSSDVR